MTVLEGLRCGMTFGAGGCSSDWLSTLISGLIVAVVIVAAIMIPAFLATSKKRRTAHLRRREPFRIVRVATETEAASRILEGVSERNGPQVIVSVDGSLAEALSSEISGAGSTPMWWEPTGALPRPPGALAMQWDPFASIAGARSAMRFASEIVESSVAWHRGPEGRASTVASGDDPGALVVTAGALLAEKFSGGSCSGAAARVSGGPERWAEAVGILDGSIDREAWALAGDLDLRLRAGLAPTSVDALGVVAQALEVIGSAEMGKLRPLHTRLFLATRSGVLFVAVPAVRGAEVAASVLLGDLAEAAAGRIPHHLTLSILLVGDRLPTGLGLLATRMRRGSGKRYGSALAPPIEVTIGHRARLRGRNRARSESATRGGPARGPRIPAGGATGAEP